MTPIARPFVPRLLVVVMAAAAGAWLLAAAGCATAFDAAQLTKGGLSQGYTTVTAAWFDYDRAQQLELVKACRSAEHPQDCARAAVDDWRAKVEARAVDVLKAAGATLKAFGDALAAGGAASRKDWSGVAGPALAAWADVARLFAELHIPITVPNIGG